jgi:transcription elongation factor GreA
MQQKTIVKNDIRGYVLAIIGDKIEKQNSFLEFTLEASREIKKTAKYDSIREEMQSEIYQLQKQQAFLNGLKQDMAKVTNNSAEIVKLGALVITNKARFYISVGLGEFFFERDRFYAISEISPMAQIMKGKKAGDSFILNNISQIIEMIY